MAINRSVYHTSPLVQLRGRPSFCTELMQGVKLGSGPTLAADAFDDARIDKQHAYRMLQYAKAFFGDQTASTSSTDIAEGRSTKVRVGDVAPARAMILDLLTAPFAAHPKTEQGKARKALREQLGLSSALNTITLSLMLSTHGAQRLAGCHVIYNGHATGATLPLFPMLQALGLSSGGYRASSYSGDKGAAPLFNMILGSLMGTDPRDFNLGAQNSDKLIDELMTPGMVIIVNAGPMLNAIDLPAKVLKRIERGDIRFVLHNAADHSAFAQLRAKYPTAFAKALAIDGANSEPKAMELDRIGDHIAAHGDEASCRHHGVALEESVAVIMGFGMMGRSIAQGVLGAGGLASNLIVVDNNPTPEALRWAAERGITVHAALPETIDGERRLADQPHGVFFVATNSPTGLDATDLGRLPQHTAVVNTNSQGLGVDVDSIYKAYGNIQEADHEYRAWGVRDGEHRDFSDMVLVRPEHCEGAQPKTLTLISTRYDTASKRVALYPPNLTDTVGQEALPTTSMIVVGVCAAADPDLKPSYNGQPHPFPRAPGSILRLSALPALTYQGADNLDANAAGSVTGSSHEPARQT